MGKTTEIHKKMQKKRIFPLLDEKNSFFFVPLHVKSSNLELRITNSKTHMILLNNNIAILSSSQNTRHFERSYGTFVQIIT